MLIFSTNKESRKIQSKQHIQSYITFVEEFIYICLSYDNILVFEATNLMDSVSVIRLTYVL